LWPPFDDFAVDVVAAAGVVAAVVDVAVTDAQSWPLGTTAGEALDSGSLPPASWDWRPFGQVDEERANLKEQPLRLVAKN
jgi:hypothetical protein